MKKTYITPCQKMADLEPATVLLGNSDIAPYNMEGDGVQLVKEEEQSQTSGSNGLWDNLW